MRFTNTFIAIKDKRRKCIILDIITLKGVKKEEIYMVKKFLENANF